MLLIPATRFVNPINRKFNPELIDSGRDLRFDMEHSYIEGLPSAALIYRSVAIFGFLSLLAYDNDLKRDV